MPSTMIHILTAHEYAPDAPGAFFCGCFAPDSVYDRARKDAMHLRKTPEGRWAALAEMAARCDPADQFMEGWLIHLFTDGCWEKGPLADHAAGAGEGWFPEYHEHIGLASYWLFHHLDWAQGLWQEALNYRHSPVDIADGPTVEEMDWYRTRVHTLHTQNHTAPSSAFPPELVHRFAKDTAERYRAWRGENPYRGGSAVIVQLTDQQIDEIEARLDRYDQAHMPARLSGRISLGIMEQGRLIAGADGCMTAFRIFYISTVFVEEGRRGRGLGRRLMEAMEARAAGLGATLIRLDTFDWQGAAFYRRLGYEQVGGYESREDGFSEYFFLKRV